MKNVFKDIPEFTELDIRATRLSSGDGRYQVTPEFQFVRHSTLLPPTILNNHSVLDLGSCLGATGAWALSNGSTSYTGVEIQKGFSEKSSELLSMHFRDKDYKIVTSSFDEFFSTDTQTYDVVVSFGSIYNSTNVEGFIEGLAKKSNKYIVIDTIIPKLITKLERGGSQIDHHSIAMTEYLDSLMVHETGETVAISSARPTVGAMGFLLDRYGFTLKHDYTEMFRKQYPEILRYYVIFEKTDTKRKTLPSSTEAFTGENPIIMPFDAAKDEVLNEMKIGWKFGRGVSEIFDTHARQHIPDYDRVIDLSVDVCKKFITDPANDRIIDIGCALGETIKRLFINEFHNLVGVDSSQHMFDKVKDTHFAYWVLDDKCPGIKEEYSAVLCNWTLHFIQDKQSYLSSVFDAMKQGSFLILTDKTCNEGTELELYHDFKRKQGVSDTEIQAKAESLKNVMFINDESWYVDTLTNLGFTKISVLNKAPCFTTFIAFKP
jgi:tRNA (cmo5U34)-methyltransferase